MKKTVLAVALLGIFASGCTHLGMNPDLKKISQDRAKESLAQEQAKRVLPTNVVTEKHDTPFMDFKEVGVRQARGDLNISANSTPFAALMAEIARKSGYSLVLADNVDIQKKVSVSFHNAVPKTALRETAFLAGYVAIVNDADKTVTVADTATVTYKVPTSILQNIGASINVGGNPTTTSTGGGSSSSGSGGSGGGGSAGGSAGLKAEFTIKGQVGQNSGSFSELLRKIAGNSAEINISPETGIVSVRAGAQSLKRVTEHIKSITRDALIEVQIEYTLLEVALRDDFDRGIDWTRILRGGSLNLALTTAGAVSNPALTATYTKATISSVVKALRELTEVSVVSSPRLVTTNHIPATLFDGSSVPYLGSIATTVTGTTGTSQTSGSTSFATEGVSLSIQPDVLDANNVQLTLVPFMSSITGWNTFDIDGNILKVPSQDTKQGFMRTTIEPGRTLILGGIQASADTQTSSGILPFIAEGSNRSKKAKEMVLLLNTNIRQAKDVDPIIGESL